MSLRDLKCELMMGIFEVLKWYFFRATAQFCHFCSLLIPQPIAMYARVHYETFWLAAIQTFWPIGQVKPQAHSLEKSYYYSIPVIGVNLQWWKNRLSKKISTFLQNNGLYLKIETCHRPLLWKLKLWNKSQCVRWM